MMRNNSLLNPGDSRVKLKALSLNGDDSTPNLFYSGLNP
jgi:hypothetical protein